MALCSLPCQSRVATIGTVSVPWLKVVILCMGKSKNFVVCSGMTILIRKILGICSLSCQYNHSTYNWFISYPLVHSVPSLKVVIFCIGKSKKLLYLSLYGHIQVYNYVETLWNDGNQLPSIYKAEFMDLFFQWVSYESHIYLSMLNY